MNSFRIALVQPAAALAPGLDLRAASPAVRQAAE
jgi:hypothetical protein